MGYMYVRQKYIPNRSNFFLLFLVGGAGFCFRVTQARLSLLTSSLK